jgi:hypothetical protein
MRRSQTPDATNWWLGFDVTGLSEQRVRLERIAQEAEEAVRAKSDFLATMVRVMEK